MEFQKPAIAYKNMFYQASLAQTGSHYPQCSNFSHFLWVFLNFQIQLPALFIQFLNYMWENQAIYLPWDFSSLVPFGHKQLPNLVQEIIEIQDLCSLIQLLNLSAKLLVT